MSKSFVYARTNHVDDYILERTAMPDKLIQNVSGDLAFEEKAPYVRLSGVKNLTDQILLVLPVQFNGHGLGCRKLEFS